MLEFTERGTFVKVWWPWLRRWSARVHGLALYVRMSTVGLGLLTIETHKIAEQFLKSFNPAWRLRVFLNGEDITNICCAADDRGNWATGYALLLTPEGKWSKFVENGKVARFLRSGGVEYRLVTVEQ